jgi:hypothetical protein
VVFEINSKMVVDTIQHKRKIFQNLAYLFYNGRQSLWFKFSVNFAYIGQIS